MSSPLFKLPVLLGGFRFELLVLRGRAGFWGSDVLLVAGLGTFVYAAGLLLMFVYAAGLLLMIVYAAGLLLMFVYAAGLLLMFIVYAAGLSLMFVYVQGYYFYCSCSLLSHYAAVQLSYRFIQSQLSMLAVSPLKPQTFLLSCELDFFRALILAIVMLDCTCRLSEC